MPAPYSIEKLDKIFTAIITSTPSSAASVLTVQHPANVNKTYKYWGAYMYCAAACTVALERGGTVATTTVLTPLNANPNNVNAQVSTANCYSASNVGVGSILEFYNLSAGQFISLDFFQSNNQGLYISPSGILDNITLRTSSISSSCTLKLMWEEL